MILTTRAPGLGGLAQAASSLVSSMLGPAGDAGDAAASRSVGLGDGAEANAMVCALWAFASAAQGGLGEDFLEHFEGFYIVPACVWAAPGDRPPQPPPAEPGAAAPLLGAPSSGHSNDSDKHNNIAIFIITIIIVYNNIVMI